MSDVLKTLRIVFVKRTYVILGILITLFFLLINMILVNKGVVSFIINSDFLDWQTRIEIMYEAIINTPALLSYLDIIFMVIIALLAGLSVSLLTFFIKYKIKKGKEGGMSMVGIILSFFGIGCASCGSVILTSLIGLSASSAIIGFLPFHGIEFLFASIILLVWSIYTISKKIQNPEVCRINN